MSLGVSLNEATRTEAKEGRAVTLSKVGQPAENVEKLKWSKALDRATLKPEENNAMRPDPFLQKIRFLELEESPCQCVPLCRSKPNNLYFAFRSFTSQLRDTAAPGAMSTHCPSARGIWSCMFKLCKESTQSLYICISYI